jgi:3-oxoacyl-[acyl-carrier protein] reductase
VAVANAGITNYGEFLDYSVEAFDRLTAVNLRGSYFTAQAAARRMIAAGAPGRIILMSSVTGGLSLPNLSAYGITKAGIRMMAHVLGVELGPKRITVNAVSPGAVVTERTLADDPDYEANWAGVTPDGRTGSVDDVTAAVAFLASPEARHVNGQVLEVDGGWTWKGAVPTQIPKKPTFSSRLR